MPARQRGEGLTYTPQDVALPLKQKIDWVLAAQVSPHAELLTSAGFGPLTRARCRNNLGHRRSTANPRVHDRDATYDVTVEGTKLIQAMEEIDRERDLLTVTTGGDPAARIDLAPLAEEEEETEPEEDEG